MLSRQCQHHSISSTNTGVNTIQWDEPTKVLHHSVSVIYACVNTIQCIFSGSEQHLHCNVLGVNIDFGNFGVGRFQRHRCCQHCIWQMYEMCVDNWQGKWFSSGSDLKYVPSSPPTQTECPQFHCESPKLWTLLNWPAILMFIFESMRRFSACKQKQELAAINCRRVDSCSAVHIGWHPPTSKWCYDISQDDLFNFFRVFSLWVGWKLVSCKSDWFESAALHVGISFRMSMFSSKTEATVSLIL